MKAKASAVAAVKAARLYYGTSGLSIKVAQRFYVKLDKAVTKAAKDHGMDRFRMWEEVIKQATSEGAIVPTPGKDY